jgi:hypothetical protein
LLTTTTIGASHYLLATVSRRWNSLGEFGLELLASGQRSNDLRKEHGTFFKVYRSSWGELTAWRPQPGCKLRSTYTVQYKHLVVAWVETLSCSCLGSLPLPASWLSECQVPASTRWGNRGAGARLIVLLASLGGVVAIRVGDLLVIGRLLGCSYIQYFPLLLRCDLFILTRPQSAHVCLQPP